MERLIFQVTNSRCCTSGADPGTQKGEGHKAKKGPSCHKGGHAKKGHMLPFPGSGNAVHIVFLYNLFRRCCLFSPKVCIAQFNSDEQHLVKYPLTVQIYPSAGVFNPARIALMQQMKWKKAAIIFQNYNLFRAVRYITLD